jgi:hypothetical protein
MNVILLRMAYFSDGPVVWHEAGLPNVTTLKALSVIIQKAFDLSSEGPIEYEVLGCRAPGCRGRLRDLIISGITRFRYVQNGARKQCVEIDIVLLPRTPPEHSMVRNSDKPHGPTR